MRGRHARSVLYRHKHEPSWGESLIDWISTLLPGWCYVGIYGLCAAAGILIGIIVAMIK